MANPWDADEIIAPAPNASRNPWDDDEIIEPPVLDNVRVTAPRDPAAQEAYIRQLEADEARYRAEADKSPAWEATKETASTLGRQLGWGARAVAEGIGDTVDFFAAPLRAGIEAIPGVPRQYGMAELAGRAADAVGLPVAPESEQTAYRASRAIAGAVGGAGAARQVAQTASRPVVKGVANAFAMQPGVQAVSAGTGAASAEMVRQGGGSEGQQMAAGLVGGLVPVGSLATIKAGTRGLLRGGEAGRQQVERQINNFATVGATPTVGQATNAWRNQAGESLLAGGPASSGVMARRAESQAEQIGAGLRAKADQLSPGASAERAGRAIEKGADLFAGNVRAMRNALYWQADQFIPDATPVTLRNTQAQLARLTTPTPGAEATTGRLINPKVRQLAEDIQTDLAQHAGGGLPYSAVRSIRSKIGEALSDYSLTTDKPTAEYKALYKALSQDLEAVAQQMGPDAQRAAKRANNYFRASADRLETVERVIDRNGGPERVYNAVMAGTQDGATVLRSVMRSLPKDGQKAVTAAVIKRMGLANPGMQDAAGDAFSAANFLTNWNKVSPEARKALFDVHGPAFTRDMDKIAAVAETIKNGSKVYANPSGTGNRLGAYAYISGLTSAGMTGSTGTLAGLVLGGMASNVVARLMTNPKTVHWLAETTRMPVGALPQAARQLYNIGKSEGDDELMSVAESLQATTNESE